MEVLYLPSLNVYDALKVKGLVKNHCYESCSKFSSSTHPVTSHYNHIVMFVVTMMSVRMQVDMSAPMVVKFDVSAAVPTAFRVLVEKNGHCDQQKQNSNTKHSSNTFGVAGEVACFEIRCGGSKNRLESHKLCSQKDPERNGKLRTRRPVLVG